MNITTILGIALAISMLGNIGLGRAYLSQRDTGVEATANLAHATGAAVACSDSVDTMATQGAKNAAAAAPARAKAAATAGHKNVKADKILTTPAAVPGDDCKSATARSNDWFKDSP
ncbi:hypothetical protein [Polaromonas sp.]|uniref:hypothetical protein n=1 Tax=Polaromonas sp. TaxID=1869339 RepID=UPI003267AB09